jgi:hypothetical protein
MIALNPWLHPIVAQAQFDNTTNLIQYIQQDVRKISLGFPILRFAGLE